MLQDTVVFVGQWKKLSCFPELSYFFFYMLRVIAIVVSNIIAWVSDDQGRYFNGAKSKNKEYPTLSFY